MRVLLFSLRYPPHTGGAATYYSTVAGQLAQTHQLSVLTSYHADAPLVETEGDLTIYRVIPYDPALPWPLRALVEATVALLASLALVLRRDVDLLHAHATSYATLGVALSSLLGRTPIVYDCRDVYFPHWVVRLGFPAVWLSCAPNIDDRLRAAGVDEADIVRAPVVNPDYVAEFFAPPADRNDEPFEVVYVGDLRPEKGVHLLVDAVETVARSRACRLTLVGDGPASGSLREQVESAGLADEVALVGTLPHCEAVARIAEADALVLPSESEGLPRVILEAFAVGTPVVATPVGSIPEVVIDGETGLLVDRDAAAIAAAIERLQADPDLRDRLATNAKTLVTERHSPDLATERIETAYERCRP